MRALTLLFSFLAVTSSAAAFSCTSNQAGPGGSGGDDVSPVLPATDTGLPCDVDAVLASRCRTCHGQTPLYGAPMPLVTHANVKPYADRIGTRIHDNAKPMPPPPNARLSAADSATIDSWIAAGAPASADACTPPSTAAPTSKPLTCKPDVHMQPASAWAMPADVDDVYVCYGIDVTVAQKRHLTAIAPLIDNPGIVHHLVLFQASQSVSPTPQPCSEAMSVQMHALYGWAPGGKALELPPEAGFAEEGTMHYVVQVHYNNVKHAAAQVDQSGFDFCTTDQLRPNDADGLVFGTTDITIPAHGTADISCDYNVPAELANAHVFASMPHMHQLGTSIGTSLKPSKGGAAVNLGSRAAWDFGNQPYETVSATLAKGDVVTTECAWKNPTDTTVGFGPYTHDEMCFSFMMYYPKITSPQWTWMMPAIRSTCTPR